MSQHKKTTPAAKPVAAAKPPKKLIPRPAPKAEPVQPIEPEVLAPVAASAPAEAVMPAATTAAAKAAPKAARKPAPAVKQPAAQAPKVKAEAPVKAQTVVATPVEPKAGKAAKPAKAKKTRLVRDSYAMPEAEYAAIAQLKKRLAGGVKKSELLRAGIALLAGLNDADLLAAIGRIERIKTGRPAK